LNQMRFRIERELKVSGAPSHSRVG
jgi:hypothetical protein